MRALSPLMVFGEKKMEAKEIPINSIEELDIILNRIRNGIDSVKKDLEDSEKGTWKLYFRGEAKKYDEVNASIFRDDFLFEHEGEYLKSLLDKTNLDTSLSNLGKIQHYGGCTRLMDFTKDFNVALYFVCCEHDDEDGYIYCYDTQSITDENSEVCKILSDFTFLPSNNLQSDLKIIAEKYSKTTEEIKLIVSKDYFLDFDLLKKENLRMTRQEGLFLWMGDSNLAVSSCKKTKATPLSDENGRGENYPGVVLKVIVPNYLKKEIRTYLARPRTYTKGYLFPDEPKGTGYNFHSAERKYFEKIINCQKV